MSRTRQDPVVAASRRPFGRARRRGSSVSWPRRRPRASYSCRSATARAPPPRRSRSSCPVVVGGVGRAAASRRWSPAAVAAVDARGALPAAVQHVQARPRRRRGRARCVHRGRAGRRHARGVGGRAAARRRTARRRDRHAVRAAPRRSRSSSSGSRPRSRRSRWSTTTASALLRSVSHDLRTPLVTIRAVTSDLRDGARATTTTVRDELLDLVGDEAERLDRSWPTC